MSMALLVLHVFLSLGIITLVLLQKGAGASAGAAFGGGGGGGAGSIFGASGSSNFLSKMTGILATAFFVNSLALAYIAANRDVSIDSVIDALVAPTTELSAPASTDEEVQDIVPAAEFEVPPPVLGTTDEVSDIPPADEAVTE